MHRTPEVREDLLAVTWSCVQLLQVIASGLAIESSRKGVVRSAAYRMTGHRGRYEGWSLLYVCPAAQR